MSEDQVTEPVVKEVTEQQEQLQIDIDAQTAFALKMQEFDKNIAEAEANASKLKLDRAAFVYDNTVQQVVAAHKERLIRQKVEEEARAAAPK